MLFCYHQEKILYIEIECRSVTHTLSLTIREAGKLMMSETDMKGMN